ncbi:cytochrome c [Rugamonas sp.]|uniref:c-type cytochrome n=1 Tax=Rugamonas sp. TaxID=1926287 RepID=UPI0025FDE1E5|nr:cytochrome c [Rugamonas sp.]
MLDAHATPATQAVQAAQPAHASLPAPTGLPDAELIVRGAYLAKLGDCIACHSTPAGKAYAGGLPMKTPVGTIYSTNISPDQLTGIGGWSEQDFERALRRGVARDGHNLYPAMPYPSYAKVSDADVRALYAYFMRGVPAVRQPNRESAIGFPLNQRWPLKVWNMLFLDRTPYQAKPAKDAEWNRGAYLAQGLGHCGSCHTPRGVGFQEQALDEGGSAFLAGAALDGWYASSLVGDPRAGLGRWSEAELQAFLRTGANPHASAYGSMTDVINNSTQFFSERDLAAVAHYLKSIAGAVSVTQRKNVVASDKGAGDGAKVYRVYCMQCHGADGRGHAPLLAPLAGNPTVIDTHASSLINVTLNGTRDIVIGGIPQPYPMPAFGKLLNDQQVADAVSYIRTGWNNGAPPVTAQQVAKVRKETPATR